MDALNKTSADTADGPSEKNGNFLKSLMDYADIFLTVWVIGYEKGDNLCNHLVAPPGHEIS